MGTTAVDVHYDCQCGSFDLVAFPFHLDCPLAQLFSNYLIVLI